MVGGAIHWSGSACGAATTANTDTIAISAPAGSNESLTIDQSGGAFAPGATGEGGTSEIEITVALGDTADPVVVLGTSGNDTISIGANGVSTNTDTDVDITFSPRPARIEARGLGGVNTLTALGGLGSGSVFPGTVALYAGDNGDTLRGTNGADTLVGGNGNDTLDARSGDDTLTGGAGNDTLTAGNGNDTLTGGAGRDTFSASGGNDVMYADDDEADASINGGSGSDTAYYDQGVDPLPTATETRIPA